jgi:hypothetical protein
MNRPGRDYDDEGNSDRVFTGFAAVLATVVGVVAIGGVAGAAMQYRDDPDGEADPSYRRVRIPETPCKTEDGPPPCFWDAGRRGPHGRGYSFWLNKHGRVTYLDPRAPREPYGGCDEQSQPGNRPLPECTGWRPFRDVEGHSGCQIWVGPTSLVMCEDGWWTQS